MTEYSEQELLHLFRNPEQANYAFDLIVKKYRERVYWHVRRILIDHEDSNDVVQEIFIKAWKGLENFRAESGLFTWLYRIATNEALTFLNKKKKRFFIPWQDAENLLLDKLEADPYFKGDEIQKKLQKAIISLPEKQRLVFNMKYFEDVKYEEMSKILNTSEGALKASYHHAVKKIELFLKNH